MAVAAEFSHPLLSQIHVDHVRDTGALVSYVPRELINDGNIPTDPDVVKQYAAEMQAKFQQDRLVGNGQITPVDLVLPNDADLYELRDGAHRIASLDELRFNEVWSTIEVGGSWESVRDGRFAATTKPQLYLARYRPLAEDAWQHSTCSEITIDEAMDIYLAKSKTGFRKKYGSEKVDQVIAEVARKLTAWKKSPEEVYKYLRSTRYVDPTLIRGALETPKGRKRSDKLSRTDLETLGNLQGKPEIQQQAAQVRIAQNLSESDLRELVMKLDQINDPSIIAEMIASGSWRNSGVETIFERKERLVKEETAFVADAYMQFFKQITKVPTSRIVSDDRPLHLLDDQDNPVAQELRNRSIKKQTPYELGTGERVLLPLDLTTIRGFDNQPNVRHARASLFLGLLGINTDLSFLDGLYKKDLTDDQIAVRLAHPQRPLTVWGVGSSKRWHNHLQGILLDKLWVVYSENFKGEGEIQKNRKRPPTPIKIEPTKTVTLKRPTDSEQTSLITPVKAEDKPDVKQAPTPESRRWGETKRKEPPAKIDKKLNLAPQEDEESLPKIKATTISDGVARVLAEVSVTKPIVLTREDIKRNQTYENGKGQRVIAERIGIKKNRDGSPQEVVYVSDEGYRGSERPIPLDQFLADYGKATFRK